jgi:hypothetical protein
LHCICIFICILHLHLHFAFALCILHLILHSHRAFHTFCIFVLFFFFLVIVSRLMHQKVVKSARWMRKICNKNRVKMQKKVWNAYPENWAYLILILILKLSIPFNKKRGQNSHHIIALHYCDKKNRIFALFFCIAFASHYHPCGQDFWIIRDFSKLWHDLVHRASDLVLLQCLTDASLQCIKRLKTVQSTQWYMMVWRAVQNIWNCSLFCVKDLLLWNWVTITTQINRKLKRLNLLYWCIETESWCDPNSWIEVFTT